VDTMPGLPESCYGSWGKARFEVVVWLELAAIGL